MTYPALDGCLSVEIKWTEMKESGLPNLAKLPGSVTVQGYLVTPSLGFAFVPKKIEQ